MNAEFLDVAEEKDLLRAGKLLEKGANPNARDWLSHETALKYAAWQNNSEMVRFLLENKANPNYSGSEGNTPLHDAVLFNSMDAARVLLENKANPRLKNEDGHTPADLARQRNYKEILKLIEHHSK